MSRRRGVMWRVRRLMGRGFRLRRPWTEDVPYKSPQEIALENAADSLGVTLGEYYADDLELSDVAFELDLAEDASLRSDASREELLAYVDGLREKRRRRSRMRRRRLAGGAAVLAMVVAAAVVWLPSDSGQSQRVATKELRLGPGGRPVEFFRNALSPLGASVSSEISDGSITRINLTYLNPYGDLCSAVIERRGGISKRNGGSGCVSLGNVVAYLRRKPAFVASVLVLARRILIAGYAREDVEQIAGSSPWGAVRASVTPAWSPSDSGHARHRPLRGFLVVAPREGGGRGGRISRDPLRSTLDDRRYNLTAQLRAGRVVPVETWTSLQRRRPIRLFDPIVLASG